ncbi:hypothetical protein ACP70R_034592 [Stipagrostis hirtigluma subsp. patula]
MVATSATSSWKEGARASEKKGSPTERGHGGGSLESSKGGTTAGGIGRDASPPLLLAVDVLGDGGFEWEHPD